MLLKLLAGRVLDWSDVAMLLRENHASLDHAYMALWLGKLDLEAAYEEARQLAFPEE